MEPTTLQQLIEIGCVTCLPSGIAIQTQPTWVVMSEARLSYTTLTRLVECCREYHWQNDILPNSSSVILDSICKSLNAEFLQPVPVGTRITITYQITQIREKGYELQFKVHSSDEQILHAIFSIVSVFYNPFTNQVTVPPKSVLEKLAKPSSDVKV